MKSIQYTIRSIPPRVDQQLRARAKQSGKSLNEAVIEALAKATGLSDANGQHAKFHDLDWFIGSMSLDKSFDEAMEWLERAPKDIK